VQTPDSQTNPTVPKRQRIEASSSTSSRAIVLYVPTGSLTEAHCTTLKKIIPNGFKQGPLLDFLSQMPAAQVDGWLVQMQQASNPDEAEKLVKGWNDDYHKELKKNGSENLQKREAEFRKVQREVQDTALRLEKSSLAEMDTEIDKANAQLKELKKRGFADAGPSELWSTLRGHIQRAHDRVTDAYVKACIPDARAWASRLETAPASIEWNAETLAELYKNREAFARIGKAHLLPTLRDPEPVAVWNRQKMCGGIAYANQICCTFDTVAGPQNVWAMISVFSSLFVDKMGAEAASAKFKEILQRAEAGELPVDDGPTPPTDRVQKALPPLAPHSAGNTPFDELMRAMQMTTDAPPDAYNDRAKLSMNAKIDPAGSLPLHLLGNKLIAFCADNDLDLMNHIDGCECYLKRPSSRGKKKVDGVWVFDPPYTTVDDFPHCGGPLSADFFAKRGLRLVFPHNADPIVLGVAAAPIKS